MSFGQSEQLSNRRSKVSTTAVNSLLTVRNPAGNAAGNAAALTVTPLAGGAFPVSAHLVITQIG
ncbi:MAG: hypothetical protein E7581_00540 [Ruminococcaceae bacterium]|nr:hypothetical protein [Oscillospiraceae bacterium]